MGVKHNPNPSASRRVTFYGIPNGNKFSRLLGFFNKIHLESALGHDLAGRAIALYRHIDFKILSDLREPMLKLTTVTALALTLLSVSALAETNYWTPENLEQQYQAATDRISPQDFPLKTGDTAYPRADNSDVDYIDLDGESVRFLTFFKNLAIPENANVQCQTYVKDAERKFEWTLKNSGIARYDVRQYDRGYLADILERHEKDSDDIKTRNLLLKGPYLYSGASPINYYHLGKYNEFMTSQQLNPQEIKISVAPNSEGIYSDLPPPVSITFHRSEKILFGRFEKGSEILGYKVCAPKPVDQVLEHPVFCQAHAFELKKDYFEKFPYVQQMDLLPGERYIFSALSKGHSEKEARQLLLNYSHKKSVGAADDCQYEVAFFKHFDKNDPKVKKACAIEAAMNARFEEKIKASVTCSKNLFKLNVVTTDTDPAARTVKWRSPVF